MLKKIFFLLLIRPFLLIVAGVYVKGKENLPKNGPCIIAANHNSHIDTMVLMSIFPLAQINKVRPVAAADYFLSNKYLAWFSLNMIGIIPLSRKPRKSEGHPFAKVDEALHNGDIVIIFPEGTRGDSEAIQPFKTGVAHLASSFKDIPIVPIYMNGAGKCLPKGEALFVPFTIGVNVAEPIYFKDDDKKAFTGTLEASIKKLESEIT